MECNDYLQFASVDSNGNGWVLFIQFWISDEMHRLISFAAKLILFLKI